MHMPTTPENISDSVERVEARVAHLRRVTEELAQQKHEYEELVTGLLASNGLDRLRQRLVSLNRSFQPGQAREAIPLART